MYIVINKLFLFQLNAHNMLNIFINHHLSSIFFGVCYTIFIKALALLVQKIYAVCNVVKNVKYILFLIYNAVTMFKTLCISLFRIL